MIIGLKKGRINLFGKFFDIVSEYGASTPICGENYFLSWIPDGPNSAGLLEVLCAIFPKEIMLVK